MFFFASKPFYKLISFKASLMFVLKPLIEKGNTILYSNIARNQNSLFLYKNSSFFLLQGVPMLLDMKPNSLYWLNFVQWFLYCLYLICHLPESPKAVRYWSSSSCHETTTFDNLIFQLVWKKSSDFCALPCLEAVCPVWVYKHSIILAEILDLINFKQKW